MNGGIRTHPNVERAESAFRAFMRQLLSAQAYDGPTDEQAFFSFDMLRKILGKFCDVIADQLKCDSCTINLQLYDHNEVDEETFNRWVKEHLDEQRDKYEGEAIERFEQYRSTVMKSHKAFPYWRHGKGLSLLVAANQCGPWTPIIAKQEENLKYIPLEAGVTKDIYQENTARVRDRLTMRGMRNLRKLGRADIVVWNNLDSRNIFKTYYGVPIRIHSDGEVVGLLKVENKSTKLQDKQFKGLLEAKVTKLEANVLAAIHKDCKSPKDFDKLNVSLLSLAYLLRDLGIDRGQDGRASKGGDLRARGGQSGPTKHVSDLEANENQDAPLDSEHRMADYLLIPYPQAISEAVKCFKKGIRDLFKEPKEVEPVKNLINSETICLNDVFYFIRDIEGEHPDILFAKRHKICQLAEVFLFSISRRQELVDTNSEHLRVKDTVPIRDLSEKNWGKHRGEGMFVALVILVKERYENLLSKDYSSLLLDKSHQVPVQLFFTSIEDERELWDKLRRTAEEKGRPLVEHLFGEVHSFYPSVAEALNKRPFVGIPRRLLRFNFN